MAYKIAVGSSDGVNVDLKFGEVKEFLIYEVEGETYQLVEKRQVKEGEALQEASCSSEQQGGSGCNNGGCGGNGSGCSGPADVVGKVSLIEDCRCILCKKVGFQAQKQFEKKAISVFDVECKVEEALEKIIFYYNRLDNHESIRVRK